MFTEKDMQAVEQFRRVVQMFAASLPVGQAREVPTVYPVWEPGKTYPADTYLIYNEDNNGDPILYQTINKVTAAAEFPPDTTSTLYNRISLGGSGYPIWAPPTGAHDAFNFGDISEWKDKIWRSKRDGNTSEPGTDEWWELYEEV